MFSLLCLENQSDKPRGFGGRAPIVPLYYNIFGTGYGSHIPVQLVPKESNRLTLPFLGFSEHAIHFVDVAELWISLPVLVAFHEASDHSVLQERYCFFNLALQRFKQADFFLGVLFQRRQIRSSTGPVLRCPGELLFALHRIPSV